MKKTIITVLLAVGLALTGITLATIGDAFAQPDAGAVLVDAGVGSSSPAEQLDDPVLAPAAAFDDAKAMHKLGWPLLLLGCLIMLAKGLQTAGKRWAWKWLTWINTGIRATVIAGVITTCSAAYNTLALGGTWFAIAMAVGAAIFALIPASTKAATS